MSGSAGNVIKPFDGNGSMAEEQRQKCNLTPEVGSSASFYGNNENKNKKKTAKKKCPFKCYLCGKVGHKKVDCFKNKKESQKANLAEEENQCKNEQQEKVTIHDDDVTDAEDNDSESINSNQEDPEVENYEDIVNKSERPRRTIQVSKHFEDYDLNYDNSSDRYDEGMIALFIESIDSPQKNFKDAMSQGWKEAIQNELAMKCNQQKRYLGSDKKTYECESN
ncbi:uncharacterized protein LOC115888206 [Sitophilus oryzae]|uniref:Uncharacterized protein LOC115888206 n=1 Tax=Sitophilus oryzae TaxID=7048 RepID=A0A6J2YLF1_SITOR|nr:uncharacterized protein LOC115888206 [Sitophilus oryzae]